MTISKFLFLFGLICAQPLSCFCQSSTTAKGSTVTFDMNAPENFVKKDDIVSKADSLQLLKHSKDKSRLASTRKSESIKKRKSSQKALSIQQTATLPTDAQTLPVNSTTATTIGSIETSAAIVDLKTTGRYVSAMTDREIQRKVDILRKTTQANNVESDKSPKDSAYNKFLGVKFKKSVDYTSKINTFEEEDNYALLEKGASFISMNLGLASFKLDDKWIEPLVKIDDTYYTQFFVKASGGYFISNNTAAALKLSYGFYDNRIKLNSDVLQLLINAKTYETNNVGTDVAVSAVIRNYIPIGFQQRFFLVTETALGYKYSESLQRNIYDNGAKISKVQTYSHMGTLGISPGITYFMTKGFAFEFMLSPIQIYYQNSKAINDEVANGSTQSYGLTFAFTPFNIQLGFSYYFGLDYKKNHEYMSKYYNKVRR